MYLADAQEKPDLEEASSKSILDKEDTKAFQYLNSMDLFWPSLCGLALLAPAVKQSWRAGAHEIVLFKYL